MLTKLGFGLRNLVHEATPMERTPAWSRVFYSESVFASEPGYRIPPDTIVTRLVSRFFLGSQFGRF